MMGKEPSLLGLFLRSLDHFSRSLQDTSIYILWVRSDRCHPEPIADKGMRPLGWLRLTRSTQE